MFDDGTSISDVSAALLSRKISSVELVRESLKRADGFNPKLNCLITVTAERALSAAQVADREIAAGQYRGILHGIPYTAKDIFATAGIRTTAGSKILSEWIPTEDATVIALLTEAGAILVGKTNLSEFAAGPTNSNVHFGPARNPWDLERTPGGSSGGSAAAVAVQIGMFSLGTDTGGSVRIPAALSGTVGLKPTFGTVSCNGVVPLSWSLDTVGILSRNVTDVGQVLGAIAGSAKNETITRKRSSYSWDLQPATLDGVRIGLPRELLTELCDEDVHEHFSVCVRRLSEHGAQVRQVSLPDAHHALAVSSVISWAESRAAHNRWFPARAACYGPHLRHQLIMAQAISASDYLAAAQVRRKLGEQTEALFQEIDIIALPSVSITAPRVGEDNVEVAGESVKVLTALRRFVRLASCTGHPAISVPCGLSRSGLPIGLQLIGRAFGERKLLQVAAAYESISPWKMLPTAARAVGQN